MIDYIYFIIYKIFAFWLWILPRGIVIYIIKSLAWFAYTVSKKHQKIIDKNLNIAFDNKLNKDEKKKIGISAFANLIDTLFGIIERDGMNAKDVVKNITVEDEEIVQQAQKDGRKIIFITGHQGNWELLSQSIAIYFDLTLVGVGRKIDSDLMDKVLKKNRERFNVEMVYKKGAIKGCIKALSQDKAIGILIDQALSKDQSIDIKLFGQDATHTPIASILSRKFGIDLIPAFISTEDYKSYHIKIYPPIKSIKTDNQEEDLAKLTQLQADIMQKVITDHPKEWFWMHKRWKGFEV